MNKEKEKRTTNNIVQICFAAIMFLLVIIWLVPEDVMQWIDGKVPMFLTIKFWVAGLIVGMLIMGFIWLVFMILMYSRLHELNLIRQRSVKFASDFTYFCGSNYQILFELSDQERINLDDLLKDATEIKQLDKFYRQ